MNILAEIEKAKDRRAELIAKREPLWAELNALVADASHKREAELRARIKAINAELFPLEQAVARLK